MDEKLFQIIVGLASFFGAFWAKIIWDGQKEQRAANEVTAAKVHALETLILSSYVHREEFIRWTENLSSKIDRNQEILGTKLDAIDTKLDRKVNKEDCEGCPTGRWTGLERRGN